MKKKAKVALKKREYVICRGRQSGVNAGEFIAEKNGRIELRNVRRIWYWQGAASLSEIAVYGCNPKECTQSKIGAVVPVERLRSDDICEVIVCGAAGEKWLREAPEWRA